ncbi:MAG: HAD family hydrolase, partial [Lachnospiraceae bacterium]
MDALILDIDGTLWDSTAMVAKVWNQVLDTKTEVAFRATPEKLRNLFGRTLYEIAAVIFPELSAKEQQKLIDECCEKEHEYLSLHPGKIFEGVVETIKELAKRYKICIVSNCEAGYIELVMKALGIEKDITDFECPGYTGKGKGHNLKLVMERNGFSSALYVG